MSRGPGKVEQRIFELLYARTSLGEPWVTALWLTFYVYEGDFPTILPRASQTRSVQRALRRMRQRGTDGQVVYRPDDHMYALNPAFYAMLVAMAGDAPPA